MNVDVERFLSDMTLARRTAKTVGDYRRLLTLFFKHVGKDSADAVCENDVRKFLTEHALRLHPNTYFMYVAQLKTFFLRYNTPLFIWMKNNVKARRFQTETTPLTRDQLFALANEFKRDARMRDASGKMMDLWEVVHWFIAALGPRIGETCALNIGDVVRVDGDFKVLFRAETTKTKRSREVYLPRASYGGSMLHNYIQKYRQNAGGDEPLFINRDGRRLQKFSVEAKYRRARIKLEIKTRCTPHVLRHTYCTYLVVEKQVDIPTVAALTGHSKEMLLKVYSHVSQKRKMDVARKYQIV